MEGLEFTVAFGIALGILAVTLIVFWFARKSKNGLLTLSIGMWMMLFVLNYPVSLQMPSDRLRDAFIAAARALQIFALNREFPVAAELARVPGWLLRPYLLIMAGLYLAAPVITAGYLLQFVQGVRSRWLWMFSGKKETWFFTEVSDKAMQLARSALEDRNESICVVFCNVKKEDVDRVVECGAIPFSKSIDGMSRRYFRKRPSTVLCMSENDEWNLNAALALMEKHHREDAERTGIRALRWPWRKEDVIFLYVFTDRPEAELLLNSADRTGFQCRRIAENRAIVYSELREINAALEAAGKLPRDGGTTRLHFLLVGCGWIGFEMLRALIWLYGRSDILLTLTVVDRQDVEGRFRRCCPGLREAIMTEPASEAHPLAIRFIQREDVTAFEVDEQYLETDYVFVALSDDASNLEKAISLRQAFRLLKRNAHGDALNEELPDFSQPQIRVAMNNPTNKRFGFVDMAKRPYNIEPFADERGYYRIATMLNYPLEHRALVKHLFYSRACIGPICQDCETCPYRLQDHLDCALRRLSMEERMACLGSRVTSHLDWRRLVMLSAVTRDFYDYTYNSASSRSAALYQMCRAGEAVSEREEHVRWRQYIRTEGFQHPDFLPVGSGIKLKDWTARLHSSIVDFDDLPPSDKVNDAQVIAAGEFLIPDDPA